jgi:hypothetical protein
MGYRMGKLTVISYAESGYLGRTGATEGEDAALLRPGPTV